METEMNQKDKDIMQKNKEIKVLKAFEKGFI